MPVIWGFVLVGTQTRRGAIDDSLFRENATLALPLDGQPRAASDRHSQQGLGVQGSRSGLTPYPRRNWPFCKGTELDLPFLFNVRGVESDLGPAFNYARIFTYRHLINSVCKAVGKTVKRIREGKAVKGHEWRRDCAYQEELEGDKLQTDAYCGLDGDEIWAYPEWSVILDT